MRITTIIMNCYELKMKEKESCSAEIGLAWSRHFWMHDCTESVAMKYPWLCLLKFLEIHRKHSFLFPNSFSFYLKIRMYTYCNQSKSKHLNNPVERICCGRYGKMTDHTDAYTLHMYIYIYVELHAAPLLVT